MPDIAQLQAQVIQHGHDQLDAIEQQNLKLRAWNLSNINPSEWNPQGLGLFTVKPALTPEEQGHAQALQARYQTLWRHTMVMMGEEAKDFETIRKHHHQSHLAGHPLRHWLITLSLSATLAMLLDFTDLHPGGIVLGVVMFSVLTLRLLAVADLYRVNAALRRQGHA